MSKKVKDTKGIIIYGLYLHRKSGAIAWYVIMPGGKKKVFKTKLGLINFIDKITTNLKQ